MEAPGVTQEQYLEAVSELIDQQFEIADPFDSTAELLSSEQIAKSYTDFLGSPIPNYYVYKAMLALDFRPTQIKGDIFWKVKRK